MKPIKSTALAVFAGLFAFFAISITANGAEEKQISVQIQQQNDEDAKVELSINDIKENFTLPSMEVGDSQSITTESGRLIQVSKTKQGLVVRIGDDEIKLPNVDNEMSAHIIKAGMPLHTNKFDGIRIIGDLTDTQIEQIKQAFLDAGVDKELSFTKGFEIAFFNVEDEDSNTFKVKIGGDGENHWISDSDTRIKIINSDDNELHMETEVIVIEKEESDH